MHSIVQEINYKSLAASKFPRGLMFIINTKKDPPDILWR